MVAGKKITSSSYFDEIYKNCSLWADRLNYTGNIDYKKSDRIFIPDQYVVRDKFAFLLIEKWSNEDGEEAGKYSIVHQDWKRFYPQNMRASSSDLGAFYDIGGIRLTSKQNNISVTVEVSDEGALYFPACKLNLNEAGKPEFKAFYEPSRKFVRIVCTSENSEETLDYYPCDLISVELYASVSANQNGPVQGATDAGIVIPAVFPEPFTDKGNEQLIPLSGIWKMTDNPPEEYWKTDIFTNEWLDVPVPGDPDHHGSDVYERSRQSGDSSGATVVYKQTINIPSEMTNKQVILRFESVVSYSRIFVNGCFVRSHRGAMTPFDCDITNYVKPGLDAEITVCAMLENRKPDFTMVRGIAGYVWLFAIPETTLSVLRISTGIENKGMIGTLKIREKIHHFKDETNTSVLYHLYAHDNSEVNMKCSDCETFEDDSNQKNFVIDNPHLWSAEDPYLYTLDVRLQKNGKDTFITRRKVGFRSIEICGNRLLVNGNEEKLHGVNWMSHSAFEGLASDYESDRESLIKLKAGNVNYIRTSHNPQRKYVHELCDELGIYVEEEMSTVFLSRWVPNNYERFDYLVNPKYQQLFVQGYAEMMANASSNVSVLYYSLGNESDWSVNVKAARDYLRVADPVRPHKFSWGYSHPSDAVEILSEHYTNPKWMGAVSDKPVIYDEHAHTLGENLEKIESDPSHRDMYAYRLKEIWEAAYNKPGGLGIAIWNGREFSAIRNGEHGALFSPKWGVLDLWNRVKPEFWHMRKIFTPIYIDETLTYRIPSHGKTLQIAVQNRYSQTNFENISLNCFVNGEKTEVSLPVLVPAEKGYISINRENWKIGDKVELYFCKSNDPIGNNCIDQYELIIESSAPKNPLSLPQDDVKATLFETQVEAQMNAGPTHFWFGRFDALIHGGKYKNKTLVTGGPYLNLGTNYKLTFLSADSVQMSRNEECVIIVSKQHYKELEQPVVMTQKFYSNGKIQIGYSFDFPEKHNIDEVGVTLHLKNIERQIWSRKSSVFTSYPDDHIGRLSGDIKRNRENGVEEKLCKPQWFWNNDESEFQLKEKGSFNCTRDFRAAKRDYYYVAGVRNDGIGIAAVSDGHGGSVRFELSNDNVLMNVNSMSGSLTSGEFGANHFELSTKQGTYSASVNLQIIEL